MTMTRAGSVVRRALSAVVIAVVVTGWAAPTAIAQQLRPVYQVFAFGDSYASGEGAPGIPGNYDAGGDNGRRAVWSGTGADLSFTGDVETGSEGAQRCHRSPRATAPLAVKLVEQDFPRVEFNFRSFACSGAKIDIGVLGRYQGIERPDRGEPDKSDKVVRSQIDQANAALEGARPLDQVLMNIGGNNMAFGTILGNCIELPPPRSDPCSPKSFSPTGEGGDETADLFATGAGSEDEGSIGVNKVERLFLRMRNAFSGPGQVGDPKLRRAPRSVLVTGPPDVIAGGTDDCRPRDGFYDYEERLSEPEEQWFAAEVLPTFVRTIRDATAAADRRGSDRWGFVDESPAFTQGLCALSDNRINRNADALARQGFFRSFTGALRVSAGFAHPTEQGYADMAKLLAPRMEEEVVSRFVPNGSRVTPDDKRELSGGVRMVVVPVSGRDFTAMPAVRATMVETYRTRNSNTPSDTVDYVAPAGNSVGVVRVLGKACGHPVNTSGTTAPIGCAAESEVLLRVGTPGTPTLSSVSRSEEGLVSLRFEKSSGGPALRRFVVRIVKPTIDRSDGARDPACGMVNPGSTQPGGPRQTQEPGRRVDGDCRGGSPPNLPPTLIPLDGDLRTAAVPGGAEDAFSIQECTDRGCGPFSAARNPARQPGFVPQEQVRRDPNGLVQARIARTVSRSSRTRLFVGWHAWKGWRALRSIDVEVRDDAGALARFALDPRTGRVRFSGRGGATRRVVARSPGRRAPKREVRSGGVRFDAPRARMVRVPATAAFELPLTLGAGAVKGPARIVMSATARSGKRQRPLTAATFTIG